MSLFINYKYFEKGSLLLFALLCLIANDLLSQDFQPGYIITNSNDTIYGFVNNRSFIENSRTCEFKKDNNSEIIHYRPFEINAYRFNDGKFYVSKEVKIDSTKQKVFLEYLIKGKANFYYMRIPMGDYYFLQKENDTTIFVLKSDEVYLRYDGTNNKWVFSEEKTIQKTFQSNIYIGTMKYIFRDAPQLYGKIEKTKLDNKSLIALGQDYQKMVCQDENCIVYEKKTASKFALGITGQFNSKKYIWKEFPNSPMHADWGINTWGLVSTIQMPLLNEKLYLRPSLLFNNLNYSLESEETHFKLSEKSITLPVLVKYDFCSFLKNKLKLYFGLGLEAQYIYSFDVQSLKNKNYVSNKAYAIEIVEDFKQKLFLGFESALGINYYLNQRLFLDLSSGYGYAINRKVNMESISVSLGFGYFFR